MTKKIADGTATLPHLSVALRTANGRVVGVALRGAADSYAVRDLRAAIVLAEVHEGLLLDLSGVRTIDDVGLDHLKRIAELGGRFQHPSPAVMLLLEERGEPDALLAPDLEAR